MSEEAPAKRTQRWPVRHAIVLASILVVSAALTAFLLLTPFSTRQAALALAEGDVASQDVVAPRQITYQSEVLTEQQQEAAALNVEPVYEPPDASIARTQVERLRNTLTFITNVRADSLASTEQKMADLAALQDINLSQESAEHILELNEAGWQSVEQEAISVLEAVMRNTIREDKLEEARRSVPALVSLSMPEDQATLVAELVSAYVAPNSLYSESATEAARQAARNAVQPVTRSFVANETVVQRGEVITAAHLEALEALGLIQPQIRWQDRVGVIALVSGCFLLIALYLRYRRELLNDLRSVSILAILFMVFLIGARLTTPGRTVIPYVYPLAGFGMLVTVLFNSQTAMVLSVPLGVLAAYGLPNALDLTLYYVISSMFGALVLKRGQRIATFFWAGAATGAAGAVLVLAYRLPETTMDLVGITTLVGAAAFMGLASGSLTILLQFLLAKILGLTTTLELHEISRPDHPLLQFILRTAPGTYQHSLQIANLAEQAAELVGAEALLTRVGALYHDAGKARFPQFFIENQVPGSQNPHDELTPLESAKIIIRHVPDGVELARKHRLPGRIQDFIREHHGTMLTRYQYARAVEAAGGDRSKVDREEFRYPGPRPQSRETGLVMLADGCEARARAERPKTKEELYQIVKDEIEQRVAAGQLDDTELTMRDLNVLADSFTATLRGVYHPRIQYPELKEITKPRGEIEAPEIEEAPASKPR